MRWLGNYPLEWLRGPWPEIYFIRHGHGFHQVAREMEKKGLVASPREAIGDMSNHLIPLSPFGRWQARETGRRLIIKPDCIYSSQIRRAIETAELIFPGTDLLIDPRLNEREAGPAHLRSKRELKEAYPDFMARYRMDGHYFATRVPGGENFVNLFLKNHSFVGTLKRDWAGKTVVVVCHSAVMNSIRQIFEHFLPDELLRVSKEQPIENCGILHYRRLPHLWGWRDGKFRLELARPPYRFWQADADQEEYFWRQAMEEIESLRASVAR